MNLQKKKKKSKGDLRRIKDLQSLRLIKFMHSYKKRKDSVETRAEPAAFFFITWVPEIIGTQSTRACIKYKQVWRTIKRYKIKGLSLC